MLQMGVERFRKHQQLGILEVRELNEHRTTGGEAKPHDAILGPNGLIQGFAFPVAASGKIE